MPLGIDNRRIIIAPSSAQYHAAARPTSIGLICTAIGYRYRDFDLLG